MRVPAERDPSGRPRSQRGSGGGGRPAANSVQYSIRDAAAPSSASIPAALVRRQHFCTARADSDAARREHRAAEPPTLPRDGISVGRSAPVILYHCDCNFDCFCGPFSGLPSAKCLMIVSRCAPTRVRLLSGHRCSLCGPARGRCVGPADCCFILCTCIMRCSLPSYLHVCILSNTTRVHKCWL